MRHFRCIAITLVAAVLQGCSAISAYESTAAELSGIEYTGVIDGFEKLWKPLGKDGAYSLSQEEAVRGGSDLDSCISSLSERFVVPHRSVPSRELRVVQLLDCMQSRGWHLVVTEVLVLDDA